MKTSKLCNSFTEMNSEAALRESQGFVVETEVIATRRKQFYWVTWR